MNVKHSGESRRRFIKVGLVTAGALQVGLLSSRVGAAGWCKGWVFKA